MSKVVKLRTHKQQNIQLDGFVVEIVNGRFMVETSLGKYSTGRAFSCLVEPATGDRVLIAGEPSEDLFIISVLERTAPAPVTLIVEGDLTLGLPNGRFCVAAAKGVDLVSAGDMTMTSSNLTVRSTKGDIFMESITLLGKRCLAEIEAIKLIGGFFDTVMERISQRVKRFYKTVEEYDQVRSQQIDYRADKNMSLRGENALVTAKELVKIDGDQIHMG